MFRRGTVCYYTLPQVKSQAKNLIFFAFGLSTNFSFHFHWKFGRIRSVSFAWYEYCIAVKHYDSGPCLSFIYHQTARAGFPPASISPHWPSSAKIVHTAFAPVQGAPADHNSWQTCHQLIKGKSPYACRSAPVWQIRLSGSRIGLLCWQNRGCRANHCGSRCGAHLYLKV